MNIRPLILAVAGAASLAAASPALAKDKDHEAARQALARKEILPITQILKIVAERLPGDVLEVELEDEKGRFIYEVKVLVRNGRVREAEIDARTGAVIKIEDN